MLNPNLEHKSKAIIPANVAKSNKAQESNLVVKKGKVACKSARTVLPADFISRVKDEIFQLTKLPTGWDGYHGIPLDTETAQFAQTLADKCLIRPLPRPIIIPGCDGSVQFAWHNCDYDIELSIYSPIECYGWRLYKSSNEEEIRFDGTNGEKFNSLISKWLEELSRDWLNSDK